MRFAARLGFALAVLLMASTAVTAADPFAGLRFSDGKSHSYQDYSKQTLFIVYACSH